jgi:hypothetical protein
MRHIGKDEEPIDLSKEDNEMALQRLFLVFNFGIVSTEMQQNRSGFNLW